MKICGFVERQAAFEKAKQAMTRKETLEIAKDIRDNIKNFNDICDEMSFDLYAFELDKTKFNVFAFVSKAQDKQYPRHKWYAVYAGVETIDGDIIYADYEHSTEHLRVSELADSLFELSHMYESKYFRKELLEMLPVDENDYNDWP